MQYESKRWGNDPSYFVSCSWFSKQRSKSWHNPVQWGFIKRHSSQVMLEIRIWTTQSSTLCFNPCSKKWEFLFRIVPWDGRFTSVFKDSIALPIGPSLSEESGQSHSGNIFNNKNSDQISFSLSIVEHNSKLNRNSLSTSILLNRKFTFFSLKLIWLQMYNHSMQMYNHSMARTSFLCWEQNRTWQIRKITACLSLCEITNVNYCMLQNFVSPK